MSVPVQRANVHARPRVLLLTADYVPRPWSGIGRAVARQTHALADLGVEVDVLVARDAPHSPSDETPRVRVRSLPVHGFPVDPRRYQWVHVHSLRLAELALEIRERFGVRLACTVHGWPHLEQPGTAAGTQWSTRQMRLLRACDHVVLLSQAEREIAMSLIPDVIGRSSVIPHGVAPPPDRAGLRWPDGPIVFAGRFAASKGVGLFVDIAERLLASRRVDIVMAGGHGDAFETAAAMRLAARYPETCRIAGWLEPQHLDALFARARAVLVPSVYEPFGLVAIEAMRMGAPILAADVGGLRDIVAGDTGGVRIRSRDGGVWADAATHVLEDAQHSARLSRLGPGDVARRFSCTAAARRLIDEVYRLPLPDGRRQEDLRACPAPLCS